MSTLPLALLWVMFALLLLRWAVAALTGLVDDEAYYRLWSLAPALSYYDHPPAVAWLIRIGRGIAGEGTFGVRFMAPVLVTIGGFALYRMAYLISDRSLASETLWFYLAMPLLAVGGVVMTPDLPSVFFYGLLLLAICELDHSQDGRWWLAVGGCAGFGCISKYTNVFACVTILIWLVAIPRNHRWFGSPYLWLAGVLAVFIVAPVLMWNAQHEWASFAKQFGRVGRGHDNGVSHVLELGGGYLGLASPVIGVLSLAGLAEVTRRAMRTRQSGDVLIAAAILPMLAYFMLHAMHDRVQANWLAPLYPVLAYCAVIGLRRVIDKRQYASVRGWALGLGFISIGFVYLHALVPVVSLGKDPMGQMRGWGSLAAEVEQTLNTHGARWVTASSYATTAQLSFAFRGRLAVAQLNDAIRFENLPVLEERIASSPALYVELNRRVRSDLLETCFAKVRRLGELSREDGSRHAQIYALYLVAGATGTCPRDGIWHAELP